MSYLTCTIVHVLDEVQLKTSESGILFHVRPMAPSATRSALDNGIAATNALCGPTPRAFMDVQNACCKFRDRIQRRPGRFAVRRMSRRRDDGHIDRTIAFL